MKAMIVSLESFQKGEVPPEVKEYLAGCGGEPFIILDESSKIKTNEPCKESKKSKRTQAVLSLSGVGDRCILTGTFMSKSPVNAYDQMNFLERNFFSESMYAFAERYVIRRTLPSVRGARVTLPKKDYDIIRSRLMRVKDDPYRLAGTMDGIHSFYGIDREECRHIMEHEEYTPFKHLDELWNRIGDRCLKVKRETVLDLPPKLYRTYTVDLTPEQRSLYLQLQNMHCTDRVVVDNGLKLYLRFQDICNGYEPVDGEEYYDKEGKKHNHVDLIPLKENPKLDMLEEVLDEIGDRQVIVWCNRTRLLYDAVERCRKLGYAVGVFDGKVGREEREADYEAFARGDIQVIFVNQGSGAYGLDRLQNAKYAVYLSNDYSVEKRSQSEDRCYRGAVRESKYIIDITCRGTCEQRVTEALKLGQELLDTGTTDASLFMLEA